MIYTVTQAFPAVEKYGLVSQLRRSVSSIPMNLAEGHKRKGAKEFARFVNIAESSLEETKYSLFLSLELKFLTENKYKEISRLCDEVGKMLNGLYNTLIT